MTIDESSTSDETKVPETLPVGVEQIRQGNAELPTDIGNYHLMSRLGEGGMGEVWMAEQLYPVKRPVALKLIKAGFGSQEILARFDAERQALAVMNHSNIAGIIDAGTTPQGQPYFAMELVRGLPLTQYCDQKRLGINERLELFADVCSGVQHAHQKGIIHRDLKPSNILVTVEDGKAVPKVIDFGLAKAMDSTQRLTDQSLFTGIGQILGTLKYMSPEQAGLDTIDIDTRTDIYALGVILYELLTGGTPLDDASLAGDALVKMLDLIRQREPVKPSSRLESSTDAQVSMITGRRKTDSVRLQRMLAGDLDWIVMKALEKDRTRRYESASDFSADIRRFLNSEPVIARPPSLNYRVRKFVRKNRAGVLAASLLATALVVGMIGTSWGLARALKAESLANQRFEEAEEARQREAEQRRVAEQRRQAAEEAQREADVARREAEIARREAERERELAETRRQEAEQNLTYAKKGNQILGSVFEGLDPQAEYATIAELRNALRDNLEWAVKELEGSAIGDPLSVAQMQYTLGTSLQGLGHARQAIVLFERALATLLEEVGADHPNTATCMNNLAMSYQAADQLDKALPLYEQSVELNILNQGPDHPATLSGMSNLALGYAAADQLDKALPMWELVLERQKTILGPDDPATLSTMNNLAAGYHAAGQHDKALPLYEETRQRMSSTFGPDHAKTLTSMNNLAGGYRAAGQRDKALALWEQTLELSKSKLGPDHPNTLRCMSNLASGYRDAGQIDLALPLFEEALRLQKFKLEADHPDTLLTLKDLANSYKVAGQLDRAMPLLKEALRSRKIKLGADHLDTIRSMNDLAEGYAAAGQLDPALRLYEETLELMRTNLAADHPDKLAVMNNLARGYYAAGQLDQALPLVEETMELMKATSGIDHPDTLTLMHNLATGYYADGQMDRSLPLLEETVQLRKARLGVDHPDTLTSMAGLANGYRDTGQLDRALPLYEEAALEIEKRDFQHEYVDSIISSTIRAYEEGKRLDQAEKWRRRFLPHVRKTAGAESSAYASQLAGLGLNLQQQQKWTAAESVLRDCLAIRQAMEPDHWSTFNTRSMLGASLLSQQKFDEALPLLISGFEGLKERESSIPKQAAVRIPAALDRLIELFTALDRPEEVAKYKQLRDEYSDETASDQR